MFWTRWTPRGTRHPRAPWTSSTANWPWRSSTCKSSGAPSPSCARSTSTPTCPCASPASCACSPAWTPSPTPELPTAPLSSSPGTCTTTRRSASWSAWWSAFQARTSWKPWKSSIAGWALLRPMPPNGSGRPSPRIPSRRSPPSSPVSTRPTGCGPQPTASSSWTRSPSRTTTRPSRTCTGASNAISRPSWPSGRKGRRRRPPLHTSALVHAHQFRRGHGHGLLPRPRPAGALHGREQPRAARLRAVGHVRRHAR